MLKTTSDVLARARELAQRKKPVVAIAGAEDSDVVRAVSEAVKREFASAILVGNAAKTEAALRELQLDSLKLEIVQADGVQESVTRAVELCSQGRAQILMKGKVATSDIMRALLAPKAGLRQGKLLSHCAVLEIEGYPKLLSFTDGGVVSAPNFEQRIAIVENAVRVARLIGVGEPKVALLGVANQPTTDYPSTIETAAVARACFVRGIVRNIEGPLTFRAAFAGKYSERFSSDVAGDPDIVVSHTIEETNITVKAFTKFRRCTFMGVITGARVPLSLVSRADPPENKLASLALAAVIAGEEQ
ncbi:MAG: phosphate acyltransferase [bacterium]|nr:phosphate acyltransferase [bacterium]